MSSRGQQEPARDSVVGPVKRIPPPTLVEVVLRELREQLIRGRFAPGDPIRVDQVAAEFGISALPVREAVRQGVSAFDDAGAERMSDLLEKLISPPASATLWELAELHQEFHFVPISYARLPRVEAELRRLWDHTDHYRSLYLFNDQEILRVVHQEHREILEACVNRQADRAVELMEAHRQHALAHALGEAARSERRST